MFVEAHAGERELDVAASSNPPFAARRSLQPRSAAVLRWTSLATNRGGVVVNVARHDTFVTIVRTEALRPLHADHVG